MKSPRLTAQPMAEGFTSRSEQEIIVWRDFRWNTGKMSRMWFIDPNSVDEAEVEIRPLNGLKQSPNGG